MPLTKSFTDPVNSGKVRLVRIMMKNSLLVDPTFNDFKELENYSRNMPGLYDEHDGRELITDKSLWTEDYMDKLMVQVVSNFSHERIEHLKQVVRYLRPLDDFEKPVEPQSKKSHRHNESSAYQRQKAKDQISGSYRGTKIAAGTVIGATVGAGITLIAGASTGIVGLAAVGGAAIGLGIAAAATK